MVHRPAEVHRPLPDEDDAPRRAPARRGPPLALVLPALVVTLLVGAAIFG